jgi:hypothetical protein
MVMSNSDTIPPKGWYRSERRSEPKYFLLVFTTTERLQTFFS